jgi:hypothetical protein
MESADLRDGDDPATWRGFDDAGWGLLLSSDWCGRAVL